MYKRILVIVNASRRTLGSGSTDAICIVAVANRSRCDLIVLAAAPFRTQRNAGQQSWLQMHAIAPQHG
jgi:hypothetical protein